MGEAKRRQPDAEKRKAEGIIKAEQRAIERERAREEEWRNLTPAQRKKRLEAGRFLTMASAMAASVFDR